MKYTFWWEPWPRQRQEKSPLLLEAEQILDFVLGQIQRRRGSPDLNLLVSLHDDTVGTYVVGPYAIIGLNSVACHTKAMRRIATVGFWDRKGSVMVSNLIKYAPKKNDEESYGYYHRADFTLYAPDSLERIRGMIDKSLRILVRGLANDKLRRKHSEQSPTRRSRGPRLGRPTSRFASV